MEGMISIRSKGHGYRSGLCGRLLICLLVAFTQIHKHKHNSNTVDSDSQARAQLNPHSFL